MKKVSIVFMALMFGLSLTTGCGKGGEEASKPKKPAAVPLPSAVVIGTGVHTGIDYLAGESIAKIVNQKKDDYGIECVVKETDGPVANINAVLAGGMPFGIALSDQQYQAVNGLADWAGKGPGKDLRAVFSLNTESVTLVAAIDAGIKSILDLKGKRVDIGVPGSENRQYAVDALETVGIDFNTDLNATGVKAAEASKLLQDGRIDAFFDTVDQPSEVIKAATMGGRKVRIAEITGIDKLLEKDPYYVKSVIPIAAYPGAVTTRNVSSFGVKITLVTSDKVAEETVYDVTKEVFENLDTLKSLNPAFASLTRKSMLEGLSAPLHPGALKYFKEAGLVK